MKTQITLYSQKRIQNPVERSPNGFQSLTIFAKSYILDARLGSEYTFDSPFIRKVIF